jgi:ribonuclease Y
MNADLIQQNFEVVLFVLFLTLLAGYFVYQNWGKSIEQIHRERRELIETMDRLQKETEIQCRDMLLQARNESIEIKHTAQNEILRLRSETEQEVRERRAELLKMEARLSNREEAIENLSAQMSVREQQISGQIAQREAVLKESTISFEHDRAAVYKLTQDLRDQLAQVSGITEQEARDLLLRQLEGQVRAEGSDLIHRVEMESRNEADNRARNIVTTAIQKLAVTTVAETTVSTVSLPSEDLKGRIIGREGRNIRTFETLTGVDVIIDDTPEAVVLSSFDPVRREVARRALQALILDGRIHPSRIEEEVAKAQDEVEQSIMEAGEQGAVEAHVTGLHPELIKLIGRMHYRQSYGQNLLAHSIETSQIGAALSAELGANTALVRRACLLHDVGKVVPDVEGPHALVSRDILLKYGESPAVAQAVGAHHNEIEQTTVEDALVQLADSISAARPGARREPLESYLRRLQRLETIAESFPGVEKTYAVQAGREIRLIVQPDIVDDDGARKLSFDIARRIEKELDFPGQIKVTVIRETRSTDYAK